MEQLPNEIWLIIFSYLKQLDIYYAFADLNLRFQHLTTVHTDLNLDIDLTQVSYKLYKWFIEHLLPVEGFRIRSLSIKRLYQMKLLKESIVQLSSLKSLKWNWSNKRDYKKYCETDIDYCLKKLENFSHLTKLYIDGDFSLLQMLVLSASNTSLTSLTLLSPENRCYNDQKWSSSDVHLPNIKVLTIIIKDVSLLNSILRIANNIEELNLSLKYLYETYNLIIPKSLTKLHFECTKEVCSYEDPLSSLPLQTIQSFFNRFRNQLNSLTLIFSIVTGSRRSSRNFSEFQNFLETFPGLCTKCRYLVCTDDYPLLSQETGVDCLIKQLPDEAYIFYTNPCPRSFNNASFRNVSAFIDSSNISSNLTSKADRETSALALSTENSIQIIENLNRISNPFNNLINLKCESTTPFDGLFIIELSKIVPNLKSLCLLNGISLLPNATELTPMVAIDHVQQYLLNLIDFGLFLRVKTRNEKLKFEELKQWIKLKRHGSESQWSDNFYVEYSSEDNSVWFIKLWL